MATEHPTSLFDGEQERPAKKPTAHDRRRSQGICLRCGKAPAKEGRKCCAPCLARHLGVRQAEIARRKQAGLCRQCGKRPAVGYHCLACRAKGKSRRARSRQEGACTRCYKAPADAGGALCPECRVKECNKLRRCHAKKAAKGLCLKCGRPAGNGKRHCDGCLEKRRLQAEEATAKGLCLNCRLQAETGLRYCRPCLDKIGEKHRVFAENLKREVFSHYGGFRCACCGDCHEVFLNIDHVNNDGAAHRRAALKGKGGESLYRWLKKQGFPAGYQVLCFNCNFAKWRLGKCPHQTEREGANETTAGGAAPGLGAAGG